MKKFFMFISLTLLLIMGLGGCTSSDTKAKPEGQFTMDSRNIDSIKIIEADQPLATISDISSFERFVQAITTAEYDRGQLDIAPRDYGITVIMEDGISKEFSFWILGANTGLFTRSGQTGHYRLSDDGKSNLLDLFQTAIKETTPPSSDIDDMMPPDLQVTVGGQTFDAFQGSYCWSVEGTGRCVDMASYDQLVAKQKEHPEASSGDPVALEFSTAPEELTVTASFPEDERPDEAVPVTNDRFLLAAGSGKHMYIIQAKWPQGSASYVIEVEATVKNK